MRTPVLLIVLTAVPAVAQAERGAGPSALAITASAAGGVQDSRDESNAPQPETDSAMQEDDDVEARAEPAPDAKDNDAPSGCSAQPVVLKRAGFPGPLALSLTTCDGEPSPQALRALSEFAQPPSEHAGAAVTTEPDPERTVHPLNAGLLDRLQRIAEHFPGRAIEIVSGYRPRARPGSRHRSGDALDLRVEGVDNAELIAFVRSLEATGVGYYPNSTFVHVDVRKEAFYWVDRSGPGQTPAYDRKSADEVSATTVEEPAARAEPVVTSGPLLDSELQGLAERALVVMNLALGRTPSTDRGLPDRREL
jgi:hypothetical protein